MPQSNRRRWTYWNAIRFSPAKFLKSNCNRSIFGNSVVAEDGDSRTGWSSPFARKKVVVYAIRHLAQNALTVDDL